MQLLPLSRQRRPQRRPREPLKTTSEVAEELGINRYQLAAAMRTSPVPPPAPALNARRSSSGTRTKWYTPSTMRRWWAEHQTAKGVSHAGAHA